MNKKTVAPSLICADLCNLQKEVAELEEIGCEMLHIDIIDGIFSPDMPLGVGTVKKLRSLTGMTLDTHLMTVNNQPYVDMLLECGVDRLCFHTDYEARPTILLRRIKAAGVKAGLAVSPETKIEEIEYLLPLCDFVLLMRIDAGYAHLSGQGVYPQTEEKIAKIHEYAEKYGISIEIEVDGRVGFEETEALSALGVDTFVSGTRGVFSHEASRKENLEKLKKMLEGAKE